MISGYGTGTIAMHRYYYNSHLTEDPGCQILVVQSMCHFIILTHIWYGTPVFGVLRSVRS